MVQPPVFLSSHACLRVMSPNPAVPSAAREPEREREREPEPEPEPEPDKSTASLTSSKSMAKGDSALPPGVIKSSRTPKGSILARSRRFVRAWHYG